jgi:carotenoid 1,2-hydratase
MNVVLHTPRRTLWAMTERGSRRLQRDASRLRIGPSGVAWDGESFLFDVDEVCVPWPRRLAGTIRFTPGGGGAGRHVLDGQGRHEWVPLAPRGRVEVDFGALGIRWSGEGYLDSNRGSEPLEAGFRRWDWSRWPVPDGTILLYDAERRDGGETRLALHVGADGATVPIIAPPRAAGPRGAWGIRRELRSDPGHRAALVRSLVDAPFYTRSVMSNRVAGHDVTGVHESLNLDRFRSPVVQAMLAFRMPRIAG